MKTWQRPLLILSAGAVIVLAATISRAQEDDVPAASDGASADAEMAEDLAVMSKIVHARVGQLYGAGDKLVLWVHHDETWPQIADELGESKVAAPLANYLDGCGVVLQMELPGVRPELPDTGEQQTGKPATIWEQVQGRLRGDAAAQKVDARHAQACMQCHQASAEHVLSNMPKFNSLFNVSKRQGNVPSQEELSEALLDVLAENGHNFRQLRFQEQLSIAVTIQPWQHPLAAENHAGMDVHALYNWIGLGQGYDGGAASQGSFVDQALQNKFEAMFAGGAGGASNRRELAGDLHARQGRYDEAIRAYHGVIERLENPSPTERELQAEGSGRKAIELRRLYEKAIIASEQGELNDCLDFYRKRLEEMTAADEPLQAVVDGLLANPHGASADALRRYYIDVYGVLPPKSSESTNPARLTISATKSLLDQMAAGKITREQFKASAMIRYTSP